MARFMGSTLPPSLKATIAERLYWSYANLAMAEMAVHDRDAVYSRKHSMIRARLGDLVNKAHRRLRRR